MLSLLTDYHSRSEISKVIFFLLFRDFFDCRRVRKFRFWYLARKSFPRFSALTCALASFVVSRATSFELTDGVRSIFKTHESYPPHFSDPIRTRLFFTYLQKQQMDDRTFASLTHALLWVDRASGEKTRCVNGEFPRVFQESSRRESSKADVQFDSIKRPPRTQLINMGQGWTFHSAVSRGSWLKFRPRRRLRFGGQGEIPRHGRGKESEAFAEVVRGVCVLSISVLCNRIVRYTIIIIIIIMGLFISNVNLLTFILLTAHV